MLYLSVNQLQSLEYAGDYSVEFLNIQIENV